MCVCWFVHVHQILQSIHVLQSNYTQISDLVQFKLIMEAICMWSAAAACNMFTTLIAGRYDVSAHSQTHAKHEPAGLKQQLSN